MAQYGRWEVQEGTAVTEKQPRSGPKVFRALKPEGRIIRVFVGRGLDSAFSLHTLCGPEQKLG
jgi:hypothetical protein